MNTFATENMKIMEREELLRNKEYWISLIQIELFNHVKNT